MFGPDMSILLGAAKILSSDGKSKMWDANANGFARGEGFGVTILKVFFPKIIQCRAARE
jgi:acyl transferase domain-containing protein